VGERTYAAAIAEQIIHRGRAVLVTGIALLDRARRWR
jgi:hypothetical protein